ncbi:hypothetical protein ACXIZN_11735 [Amycolatopsis sp. TRM77291]
MSSLLLPNHAEWVQARSFGDRVFATGNIRRLSKLARCIVDDMQDEYAEAFPLVSRQRFGVNAWVYDGRFVDFEVSGFRDAELADPKFVMAAREDFAAFVSRYNWTREGAEDDRRFFGAEVFLCNEAEQDFRRKRGKVWIYRSWRRLLSPRFQPFLPLATT